MAEPKTRPTTASVAKYIAAQATPERRADCATIAKLFEAATKDKPVMWGTGIVGFGNEPVVYANGTTMDWPTFAFASRAQDIVLYGMRSAADHEALIAAVGGAKLKGGCVHIKRLSDVDERALKALIVAAVKDRKAKAKAKARTKAAKA